MIITRMCMALRDAFDVVKRQLEVARGCAATSRRMLSAAWQGRCLFTDEGTDSSKRRTVMSCTSAARTPHPTFDQLQPEAKCDGNDAVRRKRIRQQAPRLNGRYAAALRLRSKSPAFGRRRRGLFLLDTVHLRNVALHAAGDALSASSSLAAAVSR
jgi:hypothetical protein